MITKIEYKNFKILKDVCCNLTRLTVIVGPNASGKTTMLQGMDYLCQLSKHHTPEDILALFSDSQSLELSHSGDENERMQLSCYGAADEFNFGACLDRDLLSAFVDRARLMDSGWLGGVVWKSQNEFESELAGGFTGGVKENEASRTIQSLALLRLELGLLAAPSYSESVTPQLESSGAGLASALATMALSNRELFDDLQAHLRRIVPQLRKIRFKRTRIKRDEIEVIRIRDEAITTKVPREYPADTLVFDFENRSDIPATNVSEGTMLALGLLTVLHSSARPRIILLDDIEKGLHPNAQRELIGMLREILRDNPDLQIVATSHSPYFLDFLDPSEVRLMAIGPDGFSRCGLLTDHPDFPKWKDEMTPGEMWSFFGEKWLVEEGV